MRTKYEIDKEIKELTNKLNSLYEERSQTNDLIKKEKWIHKFILTPNGIYMRVDDIEYESERIHFKGFGFRVHISKKEYSIAVSKEDYCFLNIKDVGLVKEITLEEFKDAYKQGLNKINRINITRFMDDLKVDDIEFE